MTRSNLVIVGGGPAGMMAGLLFARAGVVTTVIEKHSDFLRDFRGDTVHPSTIDLIDELGLLDAFLALPHDRVEDVGAVIGGRAWHVAEFRHLPRPGRFFAMLRAAAGLPLRDLGAPIDVFWFRVAKVRTPDNRTQGYLAGGEMIVCIDRGDYFQCARVIAKGSADAVRARGIDSFRAEVVHAAPVLAAGMASLAGFDDIKLLAVSLDRLERWHRPGLLAIGDAAHAMSPVGGVGINLAVQDAVAAANILAGAMARGGDVAALLPKVQARRMLAVRVVQGLQRAIHRNVIGAALGGKIERAPLALRVLNAVPVLQRIPARVLGLGVRREHVRSPGADLPSRPEDGQRGLG